MSRYRYPALALVLWSGLLVLLLVRVYAPLSRLQQALAMGGIVLATLAAALLCWFWAHRRMPVLPLGMEKTLAGLPSGLHTESPVFLWYDPFAIVRAEGDVIQDANAVWLIIADPMQMVPLAESVRRWRGQGPDAALFAIDPGQVFKLPELTHRMQSWRYALRDVQKRCGHLSTWLLVQGGAANAAVAGTGSAPWRGFLRNGSAEPLNVTVLLDSLLRQLDISARSGSDSVIVRQDVEAQSRLRWLHQILPPLFAGDTGALPEQCFHGVLMTAAGGTRAGNLFSGWIAQAQALAPAVVDAAAGTSPFPLPLVAQIQRVARLSPLRRGLLHGLIITTLAAMLAMTLSARNNRQLLHAVNADLQAYRSEPVDQTESRRLAWEQLNADRQLLFDYEHAGVPWRLGWGLYRAGAVLPVLEQDISSYRKPVPPPTLISLDSLSLFASGEVRLKPDANRALVGALVELTTHPDKGVVIAGHTDNSGNAKANQALSEARAAAVRDWFVSMSSLPASHFAIQGYGDSRPLVPNDSPENKARNRRVEITLVPDLAAH